MLKTQEFFLMEFAFQRGRADQHRARRHRARKIKQVGGRDEAAV
jgi:hypothetical protein